MGQISNRPYAVSFFILLSCSGLSGCGMMGLSKENVRLAQHGISLGQTSNDCGSAEPGIFSRTLHPSLRTTACTQCHGNAQFPTFASADVGTSFAATVPRVDLASPASSRLVIKSRDGHCGAPCTTDGGAMTAAITAWVVARSESPDCSASPQDTVAPTPMATLGPTRCRDPGLFISAVRPGLETHCFRCHATQSGFRMSTTDDGALCTSVLSKVKLDRPSESELIKKPTGSDHPSTGLTGVTISSWLQWMEAESL